MFHEEGSIPSDTIQSFLWIQKAVMWNMIHTNSGSEQYVNVNANGSDLNCNTNTNLGNDWNTGNRFLSRNDRFLSMIIREFLFFL